MSHPSRRGESLRLEIWHHSAYTENESPQINSLRTITLLPAPSKLLEKLVLKTMQHNFESLIRSNQHSFRKKFSTTTALLQIQDTLTLLYDDSKTTGLAVMSLDFSKAFDKVDHQILLGKAKKGNLPSGFVLWLSSYLSERSFQVRIFGKLSFSRSINSGVPQGSVLGPTLFSVLAGDLPCVKGSQITQYADDVNIVFQSKKRDHSDLSEQISDQLQLITSWCSVNRQELNVDKSKLLLISKTSANLRPASSHLKHVSSLKILGVHFNDKLDWSSHVEALCKTACQRLHTSVFYEHSDPSSAKKNFMKYIWLS